jgi:hypothetical protein
MGRSVDAFGNALGWPVAGTSVLLPLRPVATSKYPWLTEINQWSSLPGVKVAELDSDFSPTVLDSASPSYALPTLVVRPSGSEWSNPFAASGLASVQWTISSITNAARSSPQEANWSFREASMAQRKLDDAQALVQYRARLANGPSMSAWDGVARQSPIDTYLTQGRGGLDAVRGEQWGMRVAQSLPDAVINEAGGLAAAKAIGMLGKVAEPVRGAIFGERSVLMSNLQTEMRAGLRADLPIGPSLEGITPGGSAAIFGNVGRVGGLPIGETPPLLALSRQPGVVTRNALSNAEFAQAQDLASFRGGKFVGAPTDSFPGIDGWLDGVPTQLKIVTGNGEQAVLRNIVKGARNMSAQGYVGDIAVDATQTGVSVDGFAKFVTPHTPVGRILNEGSVNNVYVKFGDGWLNITQGTLVVPGR